MAGIPLEVDENLYQYATERQKELLDAIKLHGGAKKASIALGLHKSTASEAYNAVKYKAARHGYAPESSNISANAPSGFAVRRMSARFDKEGKPAGGWLISEPDKEQAEEMLRAAVNGIIADAKGIFPPVAVPNDCRDNLLTVIPMGDPHFGLMSWAKETGENFDLEIAESLTFGAVDRLCSMGPRSKTAILLNLGDYFHADNNSNKTPQSGNPLDVDGRFQKIAAVGFRAMVRCIRRMLESHETVIVRNNPGNHDPHQACMLSMAVGAMFHDNPRVIVDESPAHYWYYRHGKFFMGSAHGDGAKLADLPLIMATDQPEDWAASVFRAWHCGHVHHDQVKEYPGCHVETHGTLAATDAWHRYKGYRSMRSMKSIIYDKTYGEVQRLNCNVERLAA